MPPRVGVVMCVHNGWPYLPEAVESILGQERPVDRLVIVDDASADEGAPYLAEVADPRVLVLRNAECRGPCAALQRGVGACDCDLIARLDADDVAESWRTGSQVAYMESHPETVMVCTSAWVIDERGAITGRYTVSGRPAVLQWELMFRNPVVHSSVMFRASAYRGAGGYCDLQFAEDYDLWSRLVRSGARLGAISKPCVRLRKHGGQVSEQKRHEMLEATLRIASANVETLTGEAPTRRLVRCLAGASAQSPDDALGAIDLLAEITRVYLARHGVGFGARREISARAHDRTREIAVSAHLGRRESERALRACMSGAGYSGLTTYRGARAAVRLVALDSLVAGLRRLRDRGGP